MLHHFQRDTTANIREWQYMTGPEFDEIDRDNAVVLVSVSPLEVHGPHLPVVTDNLEAEALSYRVAEFVNEQHPEITFLHLPPVYVAADVLPHHGSLAFRQSTITAVVEDIGRSLAKQGFKNVWVASFHGGPRHFIPIEIACRRVNKKFGSRMVSVFSLLINRLSGGRTDLHELFDHLPGVNKGDLVGDSHGGAVETSLMLHILEDEVRDYDYLEQMTVDIQREQNGKRPLGSEGRPSLPELMHSLIEKLKYYENTTYSGKPAIASAELGKEMMDIFAGKAADALAMVWRGEIDIKDCHSPVWPLRWVFSSFRFSRFFEWAVGYQNRVF